MGELVSLMIVTYWVSMYSGHQSKSFQHRWHVADRVVHKNIGTEMDVALNRLVFSLHSCPHDIPYGILPVFSIIGVSLQMVA
jgi:hypothetical protein